MQSSTHHYQDLIQLFDQAFYPAYNTRLVKGGDEPLYLPASAECEYHKVIFAHGYFASALHEIAHWCIAGEARRQLVDFGYWYEPDGRNEAQQNAFEQVEVAPQAIEWAFSLASNKRFRVSVDNLNGESADSRQFALDVQHKLSCYLQSGFPRRAQIFIDVLTQFYQPPPLRDWLPLKEGI
jgi:elongation factor P hydroxylase